MMSPTNLSVRFIADKTSPIYSEFPSAFCCPILKCEADNQDYRTVEGSHYHATHLEHLELNTEMYKWGCPDGKSNQQPFALWDDAQRGLSTRVDKKEEKGKEIS